MAKTWQVLNINDHGKCYVCIYDSRTDRNPYKLYKKWYDKGWHRKKEVEYQDFESVLWHLLQSYHPNSAIRL